MSASETEIRNFEDRFVYDLKAVYDMEVKLTDALDEMSRRASDDDLSRGFAIHPAVTTGSSTACWRSERNSMPA